MPIRFLKIEASPTYKIEAKGSLEMIKWPYSFLNQIWQSAYYIAPHNVIAGINYRLTFKKSKRKNYAILTKNADIKALWQRIYEYSGDACAAIRAP